MQHLVPYTPQQNVVAERKKRALKEMDICMIEAKYLSPNIWAEAINFLHTFRTRISTNQ